MSYVMYHVTSWFGCRINNNHQADLSSCWHHVKVYTTAARRLYIVLKRNKYPLHLQTVSCLEWIMGWILLEKPHSKNYMLSPYKQKYRWKCNYQTWITGYSINQTTGQDPSFHQTAFSPWFKQYLESLLLYEFIRLQHKQLFQDSSCHLIQTILI